MTGGAVFFWPVFVTFDGVDGWPPVCVAAHNITKIMPDKARPDEVTVIFTRGATARVAMVQAPFEGVVGRVQAAVAAARAAA